MSDPILFSLGLLFTIVTFTAVVLVGRSEAQDPALNRSASKSDASCASTRGRGGSSR
jgi:hypothetical protein